MRHRAVTCSEDLIVRAECVGRVRCDRKVPTPQIRRIWGAVVAVNGLCNVDRRVLHRRLDDDVIASVVLVVAHDVANESDIRVSLRVDRCRVLERTFGDLRICVTHC